MKCVLSKKFITYLIISFFIFEALLLLSFISKYNEDVFGKGIPLEPILQLLFQIFLTLAGLSLFFALCIASILSFRYHSQHQTFHFRKNLKGGILIILGLSVLCLGYNNWILPKANMEMTASLYDFTSAMPDSTLKKTDRTLFKSNYRMLTMNKLLLKIDTLNSDIKSQISKGDSILKLLPDTSARRIYNSLNLANHGLNLKTNRTDSISNYDIQTANYQIGSIIYMLKSLKEKKQKHIKEFINRIMLPVELLLIFIIGASFGFYYNDQKKFLLVILGLFTSNLFYGNILNFEKIVYDNALFNIIWAGAPLVLMIIVALIFVTIGINKEKNGIRTAESA